MRVVVSSSGHLLEGALREVVEAGQWECMEEWLEDVAAELGRGRSHEHDKRWLHASLLWDPETAATEYARRREEALAVGNLRRRAKRSKDKQTLTLPTERSVPETSPWQYAYHVCGERKIGKTTLAIAGCEEFVIQFDKPQLSYAVREMVPTVWSDRSGRKLGVEQIVKALEDLAEGDDEFPYERIVVDGVAEAYQMCTEWACKQNGVSHPSEDENWGRTWTLLRLTFTDVVNRLLRLQKTAGCGLFFISHTEWRERTARGSKQKVMRLESDLPSRCEKIVNGKVDAWFVYDYEGDDRVLYVLGSQEVGAGHRIDGHFRTKSGERIKEIHMGDASTDADFALSQFMKAFRNEAEHADLKSAKKQAEAPPRKRRRRG